MPAYDSPDYERIVTIVTSGLVSDAPDWQRVVTGPSGGSVPGAGGASDLIASDFGFAGWTGNPLNFPAVTGSIIANSGVVTYGLIKATKSATVTKMSISMGAAVTGITANENYLGLYSATVSGGSPGLSTLLSATSMGSWDGFTAGNGLFFATLATPVAVTAGTLYYAAMLYNANQNYSQIIHGAFAGSVFQRAIVPNGYVWGYSDGTNGHTTLPGSFTPNDTASNHANGSPWFVMY